MKTFTVRLFRFFDSYGISKNLDPYITCRFFIKKFEKDPNRYRTSIVTILDSFKVNKIKRRACRLSDTHIATKLILFISLNKLSEVKYSWSASLSLSCQSGK